MEIILVAIGAFIGACFVNALFWIPKFRRAKKKLFDTQKSYYRSVDIARKLREKNIEQEEKEQKWMQFLEMQG